MGIQASLTGHLVFSTLHTNDAPSSMTRMTDIGVPAYLVATSVIGVLAQRLVRVICSKCKVPYTPTNAELASVAMTREEANNADFARGKGCPNCQKKGFRGRLGVFEVMTMSTKIRELVTAGESSIEIRRQAVKDGMNTLYADGLDKWKRGITSLEEVFRVAKPTDDEEEARKEAMERLEAEESA